MKRKIFEKLLQWKQHKIDRLPLLIYGARQVGKTYAIKEFGYEYFKNIVYVNFELDDGITSYFEGNLSPEYLIDILEKYYHTTIIPDHTLIIFDEIQICEQALTSLKYFAENAPEYHVIGAGSLLGVAINRNNYSFPVGKVQIFHMHPLDFEEYLWAKGKELLGDTIKNHFITNREMKESLHKEALQEYYQYLITGGMPAVVLAHISPNPTISELEVKNLILYAYISDMAKYANNSENIKIKAAYESLPMQLAKDNKKFQYKMIKSGARSSLYGTSIDWLIQSGIVLNCNKCIEAYMPPSAYQNLSSFKLYFSDVGLLAAKTKMTLAAISNIESNRFMGAFTENYVACALICNGYDLFYWESSGIAEIDYLIIKEDHVIPIECKAGDHVKAKSLEVYKQKYEPIYSIRISTRNFGFNNGIKSVPLYAVFMI